jgi:phosphopentomutase
MADIIDARTRELVWCGKVTDTVNGIGQSEKQANQAAKDLVKQFIKDAKKVDKNLTKKSA